MFSKNNAKKVVIGFIIQKENLDIRITRNVVSTATNYSRYHTRLTRVIRL